MAEVQSCTYTEEWICKSGGRMDWWEEILEVRRPFGWLLQKLGGNDHSRDGEKYMDLRNTQEVKTTTTTGTEGLLDITDKEREELRTWLSHRSGNYLCDGATHWAGDTGEDSLINQ